MNRLVECHSGHMYAERPAAFWVEGERREVSRIVKEWNDPLGRHFIVTDDDQGQFELVCLTEGSDWVIRSVSRSLERG